MAGGGGEREGVGGVWGGGHQKLPQTVVPEPSPLRWGCERPAEGRGNTFLCGEERVE